jgi:hypothetical protein
LQGAIAVVAAEQFVAAVAAEGDFHVPGAFVEQIMGRQRRGIAHRLAEGGGDFGQIGGGVGLDAELPMFGAQMRGDGGGVFCFVVAGIVKADGEGQDLFPRRRLGTSRRRSRTVDSAGEEAAEGDVGDELPLHGLAHETAVSVTTSTPEYAATLE